VLASLIGVGGAAIAAPFVHMGFGGVLLSLSVMVVIVVGSSGTGAASLNAIKQDACALGLVTPAFANASCTLLEFGKHVAPHSPEKSDALQVATKAVIVCEIWPGHAGVGAT